MTVWKSLFQLHNFFFISAAMQMFRSIIFTQGKSSIFFPAFEI